MSAFFDSNVLVYAYSTDPRRDRALNTIADGGIISVHGGRSRSGDHHLQFYDALIVAAALEAGCDTCSARTNAAYVRFNAIFSFSGIVSQKIVNPFLAAPHPRRLNLRQLRNFRN